MLIISATHSLDIKKRKKQPKVKQPKPAIEEFNTVYRVSTKGIKVD